MVPRRRSWFALLFVVVTITGCQSADTGTQGTTARTTTTTTESTARNATTCAAVATEGQALGTAVVRFVDGTATADEVRSAATGLTDALSEARASAQADASAAFDTVQDALGRLTDALAAQPVDRTGLRAASTDVLTALGDAVALCEPVPTS